MDTQDKKQLEIEKIRREMRRKSLDQIKVYNPLETPFQTIYDGFTYAVQPRKEGVFLRYIAEKWMREFVDYMINTDEQNAVDAENDKRRKKGFEPMSPQEHDQFDIRNKLITSDPELRLKYMKMIYKGISQEHGLDIPDTQAPKKIDRRPLDEKLLERLDKEMNILSTIPDRDDDFEDIEEKKESLVKEIGDDL